MRKLAVVLVASAALTACSSGSQPAPAPSSPSSESKPKPTPTPSPNATAASLDPCKILPADAVSKTLFLDNLTAVAGPSQDNAANGGKSRSCEYKLGDKAAGALAVTRFEGREGKPADMVASIKKGKAGARDVAGFADGAVYYVDEQKTATLASAKVVSGTPVLINYTGPAKMTPEQMAPLVKTALAAS